MTHSTTSFDAAAAERGMKLLPKRNRTLHPRAQVQSLRTIAVRATKKADWLIELGQQSPEFAAKPEEIAKLRRKASDAVEACCKLNAEHGLGY